MRYPWSPKEVSQGANRQGRRSAQAWEQ